MPRMYMNIDDSAWATAEWSHTRVMLHKEVHCWFQDALEVRGFCRTGQNDEGLPGQATGIFSHVQVKPPDPDDGRASYSQFEDVPTVGTCMPSAQELSVAIGRACTLDMWPADIPTP